MTDRGTDLLFQGEIYRGPNLKGDASGKTVLFFGQNLYQFLQIADSLWQPVVTPALGYNALCGHDRIVQIRFRTEQSLPRDGSGRRFIECETFAVLRRDPAAGDVTLVGPDICHCIFAWHWPGPCF